MADVIGLDADARRRNRGWTWVLTVIFGALAVVSALVGSRDHWWFVGVTGGIGLLAFCYMVDRGYARTILTAEGMRFRTFFGRRSVPWDQVVRIEKRCHRARSGGWWDIWVVRRRGRALRIPGGFTGTSRITADFDAKLTVIRSYWSRARSGGQAVDVPWE
ncbi:PH domain-containing protein [Kutzneria buriramensis]|uniref:PH (Pleckstrin Homology) domain-containing protein n=1 Tax=Kutzneria buriramensis TaxID=1045776 RepID=A0A3E0HPQ9_9PSEU|nr:PH domain-containing protein [Kutzneria buriramensis]REH48542.1 PH (Pleckstrin Homology) domain-containing protein [Kutzneria buriramensis]